MRQIKVAISINRRGTHLAAVEDPFRHDCQSVGNLRRAVDHFQEFVAGRTTPLSRGALLRVKLDPLKAGPAGRTRHVISCHRRYEAQRPQSVPRHHDNDGGRCIPSGAINVESPGRRPGLSFGADGFRAVRLRVTEPANVGAGRLQGIGRRRITDNTSRTIRVSHHRNEQTNPGLIKNLLRRTTTTIL